MTSDPVRAAWEAEGSPGPPAGGRRRVGSCARCTTRDDLETASRVVSDRFTGYDTWADPSGFGLCPSCAWAYRDRRLRSSAHVVEREPSSLRFVDYAQLREVLRWPLAPNTAVVVLLGAARKHALPSARFGHVCVDGVLVSWSAADVDRLAAMEKLRRSGVSYLALGERTPPWDVISKSSPADRQRLLELWPRLDPWREARPWFDLGVTATTFAGTQ